MDRLKSKYQALATIHKSQKERRAEKEVSCELKYLEQTEMESLIQRILLNIVMSMELKITSLHHIHHNKMVW